MTAWLQRIADTVFGRNGEVRTRSAPLWDAGGGGNRLANWTARPTAVNAWVDNPILVRARSEGECRNNPLARRIVDCLVNAAWGSSALNPQFRDKSTQQAWQAWTSNPDATGRLDWTGLGALVLETVIKSGECFVQLVIDPEAAGVPLKLQCLGPEFLDVSRVDQTTAAGIRYRGLKPEGYWLFRQNPLFHLATMTSVFVPASDCLHIYKPILPGAQRGVPWLAPVLLPLRELGEYLEAQLVKQKVAALFAGFVRGSGGNPLITDPNQAPVLEPGSMCKLGADEDVTFSDPPDIEAAFDPFVKTQMRRISAGMGIPYELLTTDISATTFASGRLSLLEFRRTIEMVQYGLLVPQFTEPVLRRWAALARGLGVIDGSAEVARWFGPTIGMMDPGAEVRAQILSVRAGFSSRAETVAQSGWRVEDVDSEIAADNRRADQLGLVLDSDPRRTSQQGQEQIQNQGVPDAA